MKQRNDTQEVIKKSYIGYRQRESYLDTLEKGN